MNSLKASHDPSVTTSEKNLPKHPYLPKIFEFKTLSEYFDFEKICNQTSVTMTDTIDKQLYELYKIQSPYKNNTEIMELVNAHRYPSLDGVWVYFSWKNTVVHLLPKHEFLLVRTNRNREKITITEQEILQKKRLGIVGLSVGHSAALTLVQEGIGEEIKIADFDRLDLSNMNRIKTSVTNLGEEKSVIACREMVEINPFLKVTLYPEGIHPQNIDDFLLGNSPLNEKLDGPLDLVIEECDNLEMKLFIREKCQKNEIPVIMDTNDKGMIDIERFDVEKNLKILHGILENITSHDLKNLTSEQKIEIILKILGGKDQLSQAIQNSISKIGTELVGFPQLASDVQLGGSLVTHVARKILLKKPVSSGRYYVDLNKIFDVA